MLQGIHLGNAPNLHANSFTVLAVQVPQCWLQNSYLSLDKLWTFLSTQAPANGQMGDTPPILIFTGAVGRVHLEHYSSIRPLREAWCDRVPETCVAAWTKHGKRQVIAQASQKTGMHEFHRRAIQQMMLHVWSLEVIRILANGLHVTPMC